MPHQGEEAGHEQGRIRGTLDLPDLADPRCPWKHRRGAGDEPRHHRAQAAGGATRASPKSKYHEIFNHIPNPVFVLDSNTLEISDCNESVKTVYGHEKDEIIGRSFMEFFTEDEREGYAAQLHKADVMNQVRHRNKAGSPLYVNMWVSPSEYPGRQVLLVTTSDITKRLEAERKLIQASKMATLGEMATGVAHELNQPCPSSRRPAVFSSKRSSATNRFRTTSCTPC